MGKSFCGPRGWPHNHRKYYNTRFHNKQGNQNDETNHDGMQHNYKIPQIKPAHVQIENRVDNKEDSQADTFNDRNISS